MFMRLGVVSFWLPNFWLAMAFPDDFANEFASRSPVLPFGLELENILEDHGVSWQTIDQMLALEVETYWRCIPAQLVLSALQRYTRRKCACLLRDFVAAANLPDLTHSGVDREGRYRD